MGTPSSSSLWLDMQTQSRGMPSATMSLRACSATAAIISSMPARRLLPGLATALLPQVVDSDHAVDQEAELLAGRAPSLDRDSVPVLGCQRDAREDLGSPAVEELVQDGTSLEIGIDLVLVVVLALALGLRLRLLGLMAVLQLLSHLAEGGRLAGVLDTGVHDLLRLLE